MEKKPEPEMIHVELPSGGIASVSKTAAPETLAALDALMRAAAHSVQANPTENSQSKPEE